jgi:5-methylcytosine-specific restriction protein A
MEEICELLEIDPILPTVGSSIPSIFFTEIAAKLGVPTNGTMPTIAKRIIESSHLPWKVEYSSEHQPSGGGGTVTTLGLTGILSAVKIWRGDIELSEVEIASSQVWQPPHDWEELRNKCEVESISRLKRPGAEIFREKILEAYNFTCAVTGSTTVNTLEAAHIVPYFGTESDQIQNGLLLRVDIHRLFDLGLIGISFDYHRSKYVTYVHDQILTDYGQFHGKSVLVPSDENLAPSLSALEVNTSRHKGVWT